MGHDALAFAREMPPTPDTRGVNADRRRIIRGHHSDHSCGECGIHGQTKTGQGQFLQYMEILILWT